MGTTTYRLLWSCTLPNCIWLPKTSRWPCDGCTIQTSGSHCSHEGVKTIGLLTKLAFLQYAILEQLGLKLELIRKKVSTNEYNKHNATATMIWLFSYTSTFLIPHSQAKAIYSHDQFRVIFESQLGYPDALQHCVQMRWRKSICVYDLAQIHQCIVQLYLSLSPTQMSTGRFSLENLFMASRQWTSILARLQK